MKGEFISAVIILTTVLFTQFTYAIYHPADKDNDWNINQTEYNNYLNSFKKGLGFDLLGVPGIANLTRANYLFGKGGNYTYNSGVLCPECWQSGTNLRTPTGLKAVSVSTSQINISWNPVPGATGYNLYRSTDNVTYKKIEAYDGLILYYPFDEDSGSFVWDYSGNGKYGLVSKTKWRNGPGYVNSVSNADWVDGKFGSAIKFKGNYSSIFSEGYYDNFVLSNNLIQTPQKFTLSAWINTRTNSGGGIIGPWGSDIHIHLNDSGNVIFGVYLNGEKFIASNSSVNDGLWHHLAVTLDATGAKLFIDGNLSAKDININSSSNNADRWSIGSNQLWGRPFAPSSSSFNGTIDEVSIYNRALNESEINLLYNQGYLSIPVGTFDKSTGINVTSYIDQSLAPLTTYYYKVSAVGSGVESVLSDPTVNSTNNKVSSCQDIIRPGSYILSNDISNILVDNVACIFIGSDNVTLDGKGYAVFNITTKRSTCLSCDLLAESTYYGVVLAYNVTNVSIINMTVLNSTGPAIRFQKTISSSAMENKLRYNGQGIWMENSSNILLINNKIINNSVFGLDYNSGIWTSDGGDNITISNNYIETRLQYAIGLSFYQTTNLTLYNNTLYSNYQIYDSTSLGIDASSSGIFLIKNNLTNFATGISISGQNMLITNNTIYGKSTGGGKGVIIIGARNITINYNKLTNNYYGIYLGKYYSGYYYETSNVSIKNNLLGGVYGLGMDTSWSGGAGVNNILDSNNISQVLLFDVTNATFYNNSASKILLSGNVTASTFINNNVCGGSFECTYDYLNYGFGNKFTTRVNCSWAENNRVSC